MELSAIIGLITDLKWIETIVSHTGQKPLQQAK